MFKLQEKIASFFFLNLGVSHFFVERGGIASLKNIIVSSFFVFGTIAVEMLKLQRGSLTKWNRVDTQGERRAVLCSKTASTYPFARPPDLPRLCKLPHAHFFFFA
jgi:hypothetical protein